MKDQVLNDISEIRQLLAKMLGTEGKPVNEKFSIEAIEKFGFTNYFKMGQKRYFNRKDLLVDTPIILTISGR